eukprot:TRINITY_DN6888_c0_g1_i6.p1 TRINITY_DN6888_c0_g1~~TRINITY_DN6888_c0_g1_i6.p1  ORF type:complete len:213 (-),score=23.15 TRINITY_DN6888_c0_g1_i6:103-741(-)
MHVISPSKHIINDMRFDAELQILHKLKPEQQLLTTSQYAMVSILLNKTRTANYLAPSFFDQWDFTKVNKPFVFNLEQTLVSARLNFYSEFITYQSKFSASNNKNQTMLWLVMKNSGVIREETQLPFLQSFYKNHTLETLSKIMNNAQEIYTNKNSSEIKLVSGLCNYQKSVIPKEKASIWLVMALFIILIVVCPYYCTSNYKEKTYGKEKMD